MCAVGFRTNEPSREASKINFGEIYQMLKYLRDQAT